MANGSEDRPAGYGNGTRAAGGVARKDDRTRTGNAAGSARGTTDRKSGRDRESIGGLSTRRRCRWLRRIPPKHALADRSPWWMQPEFGVARKERIMPQQTMLLTASLRPDPNQPRKTRDPEKQRQLNESIALHGVLEPLGVRADRITL